MPESSKIRVTPYLNRPVLGSGQATRRTPIRVDDSALIRQAQQGNTAAFEELVRQYDRAVLRLAVHLTGSPEDGQDIYQEAFLRAYINLARFRFECSFYTWIYRIVTNLCLDHLRKKRSRGRDLNTTDVPGRRAGRHARPRARPPSVSQSGAKFCRTRIAAIDCACPGQAFASRAHGIRVEALSWDEAANRCRNAEYDRRHDQEHAVPRHP